MNAKQIALTSAFLALVFIAHAAGRIFQIGGAQLAPSIAIYILTAYVVTHQTRWSEKIGIAFLIGVLTMIATSSPFPPANIPAHGIGFLLAAALAYPIVKKKGDIPIIWHIIIAIVVVVVSWTLFAAFTWMGLTGTGFTQREFAREIAGTKFEFGTGFMAWWLFGWVGVAFPTLILAWILTPILFKLVKPMLIRQGMLPQQ